jgi:hypothetical protein
MNMFLSLMLSLPLINSTSHRLTFDEMLDSAKIIVIGKVDSIWYSTDDDRYMPWTNISATIIDLYVKSDSLTFPKGSIHIVEPGGIRTDGISVYMSDLPQFQVGETFLAAVEQKNWGKSNVGPVYGVYFNYQGKHTISRDSVHLMGQAPVSLGTAICKLCADFIKKD